MALPVFSDSAINAVIAALRDETAGNAKATITDLDFAADMLLSLMHQRKLDQFSEVTVECNCPQCGKCFEITVYK